MAQHRNTAFIAPRATSSDAGATSGLRLARYAGLDAQRRPLVWAEGGAGEPPCVARCLAGLAETTPLGASVLLQGFGDGEAPLILGVVNDTVAPATVLADGAFGPLESATADGRRLVFEARQEVVLKCGEASITLLANGRVVIKGTELVSRARGANKIRGATVSIN